MSRILLGCVLVLAGFDSAFAFEPRVALIPGNAKNSYCGLYCFYQAGAIQGKSPPLDALFHAKWLTGKYGSSVQDLLAASEEFQVPLRHLGVTGYHDVLLIGRPALVLLKTEPEAREASHWVLIVEANFGRARVFDPSLGELEVPAAELMSLWSGTALIVEEPGGSGAIFTLWHACKVLLFTIVIATVWISLKFATRRGFTLSALVAIPLALAFAQQLIDPSSYLRNLAVVSDVGAIRHPRTAEFLSPSELKANPTNYEVIDVRSPEQYRQSAIPRSMNVPIHASYWKNQQCLKALPVDRPLVLYCNSKECGWAEHSAKSVLYSRFRTVFILDDGLAGYEQLRAEAKP